MSRSQIPVIDLFAGPGGLGEGFSAFSHKSREPYRIRLSIECDDDAHRTLQLRAFFREFGKGEAPKDYYHRLRQEINDDELYRRWPAQADAARSEAWKAELGKVPLGDLRERIAKAINGAERWVLIGGPPCQAYSIVGRSRNMGIKGYTLGTDPKAYLYREYLQIIADFWPPVFVMENVKGLLSSTIEGQLVFDQIRRDLEDPKEAIARHGMQRRPGRSYGYRLRALTPEGLFEKPSDFVLRAELLGIPQARHRVIVVGIRDDLDESSLSPLKAIPGPSVEVVLADLPRLRSGLSKEIDDPRSWVNAVLSICSRESIRSLRSVVDPKVLEKIQSLESRAGSMEKLGRGAEYIAHESNLEYERAWFLDRKLKGVCNHTTRAHIRGDLHRYLFAAAFAEICKRSPSLAEFPKSLLPLHQNVPKSEAQTGKIKFADRFRVQHRFRYSTTITSHIGKDGHYYIHYSPFQCRSLTVREAARLQTFPDNYLFTGARTAQYSQVGNAVPPLLASRIAERVFDVVGR